MTEGEIITSYRQAKNKIAQVQILADLNCMSYERIVRILVQNGLSVWRVPTFMREKLSGDITEKEYIKALMRCMDRKDQVIMRLTDEYREIADIIKNGVTYRESDFDGKAGKSV